MEYISDNVLFWLLCALIGFLAGLLTGIPTWIDTYRLSRQRRADIEQRRQELDAYLKVQEKLIKRRFHQSHE